MHVAHFNNQDHITEETILFTDHYAETKHNILFKISPLHTLELWCNSCAKTVSHV